MKFMFITALCAILTTVGANAAMPMTGLYQTIDDETNQPKSIVMLYDAGDTLAGRIVALYGADGTISETHANAAKVAEKVDGRPLVVGMDIVWEMKYDADDRKYSGGKIMDPANGKVYSSVIWQDAPTTLNVRGKIGPFGRTQTWRVMNASDLPADIQSIDTTGWSPVVRK